MLTLIIKIIKGVKLKINKNYRNKIYKKTNLMMNLVSSKAIAFKH